MFTSDYHHLSGWDRKEKEKKKKRKRKDVTLSL